MAVDGVRVDLAHVIERLADGEDLTPVEAELTFDRFMDGSAPEAQMAAVLMGLRAKGLRPGEVVGGVRALRKAMVPVRTPQPEGIVDTAGTGGGAVTTFNISTAAALVAAGAGVRIAKHGNRSFTSRSGSADVLEALGVRIDLTPGRMAEVLERAGIVFMFAPLLHPAMRHVAAVRRALGITTVMNILGPLTNPAGARRQVVGVADPGLLDLVVQALAELGHHRAIVAHGEPGIDEISPMGTTRIAELTDGRVHSWVLDPRELGLAPVEAEGLRGGEPAENAEVILAVLAGKPSAARTATLLNAAAAVYVAGRCGSFAEGIGVAEESIDSGSALEALERLRSATRG